MSQVVEELCVRLSQSDTSIDNAIALYISYPYVLVEAVRGGMVLQGVQPPHGAAVSAL